MLRKHLRLVRLGWIPIRLQLGDAVRRKLNLESSITAKRWNSRMRAESRRQAADVAVARCARRDASHISDAFEHLLWLHSCSGSLGVINARCLSHLKKAGALVALSRLLVKTYSQISGAHFNFFVHSRHSSMC